MAKGLAVISGSSTVVFKALETGVVHFGGTSADGTILKPAQVTLSGSLTLKAESALDAADGFALKLDESQFKLENQTGIGDSVIVSGSSLAIAVDADGNALPLQRADADAANKSNKRDEVYQLRGGLLWAATSSIHPDMMESDQSAGYYDSIDTLDNSYELPEDFLVINSDGELRRVNKIDASAVVLNDGQNVEQKIGVLGLDIKLSQSTDIDQYTETLKDVNLGRGSLNFKDVEHRTHLTIEDVDPSDSSGKGVEVTVDLDPELRVETLSASMGLEVTGSSKLRGDLHVVKDDAAGLTGDAVVDGDMTVKGDLNVWGDTTVTTAESKHLVIEDALIRLGTDHSASTDGSDGVDIDTVQTEFGFLFGDVNTRALVLDSGDLYFGLTGSLAAGNEVTADYESIAAKNLKLYVPNLSASSDISGLTLNIGNTAVITGKLTAKADVDLGDAASDTIHIQGTLTASAPARFKGDINVANNATVTLEAASNLNLNQGSIDVKDGNLDVNGITTLSASAGGGTKALDVVGQTVLSASSGNALHVDDGDVLIDENLTVGADGIVTLNSTSGQLDLAADGALSWGQNAALQVEGAMRVDGDVLLGDNVDKKVIAQGQFRVPVFTASDLPESHPYMQNVAQPEHSGFMFYLKGEGIEGTHFAEGNKWYFCENGFWHKSFFFSDEGESTQY